MIFRLICAALIGVLACAPVSAEQRGRGTRTDSRVRMLSYNPDVNRHAKLTHLGGL